MAIIPRLFIRGRIAPSAIVLSAEHSKRLAAAKQIEAGDEFRVFSGDGREWRATVGGVAKGLVHATVGSISRQEASPAVVVEVWCATIRPNRFDWAVEKCTEAGADIIRPVTTELSAGVRGGAAGDLARWERIAIAAAEQCGRVYVPVIERGGSLLEVLERHRGALMVLHPEAMPWTEATRLLPASGRLAVAIGPEGGFTGAEVAAMRARGAIVASLRPYLMRTETAAVVATAMVRSAAAG